MQKTSIVLLVWLSGAACTETQTPVERSQSAPPASRIHKLEELTWPQIDALDRGRTLFILPVGMIVRAIGGENMFGHPRFPAAVPPAVAAVAEKALAEEAAFEARLHDWMEQQRRR